MKITTKNFLVINGLICLLVTITLSVLYFFMPIYYKHTKTEQSQAEFYEVVRAIDGLSQEKILDYLERYDNQNRQIYLYLLDDKTILYPRVSSEFLETSSNNISLSLSPSIIESGNSKTRTITQKVKTEDGKTLKLEAQYSMQPVSDASYILLQSYPVILVISLLIGGISAYIYSRSSTKRIKLLSLTTRKMVNLETVDTLTVKGKDEIAELTQDIQTMYQKLRQTLIELEDEVQKTQESERSKEEFLRMTSHELKTPITSMMGIVDGMILNVGDFKRHDYYLKECRRILEEQAQLVQSILLVSRLDLPDAFQKEQQEMIVLSELLEKLLPTYRLLADLKQFQLTTSISEGRAIRANKVYLEKAIKNILGNAFSYTVPNGNIVIKLHSEVLVIENQVQRQLTPEELSQIFTPFYRPDYSRARKDGGTGLGLYIVQKVLDNHHFAYCFEPVGDDRMRFTIRFVANT